MPRSRAYARAKKFFPSISIFKPNNIDGKKFFAGLRGSSLSIMGENAAALPEEKAERFRTVCRRRFLYAAAIGATEYNKNH